MIEANILLADALRAFVGEADCMRKNYRSFIIKSADRISLGNVTLISAESTSRALNSGDGYEEFTVTFRILGKHA